jgi:hypothetical protein
MRHVAVCFVLLVIAVAALAQVGGTDSIEGTVADPSGAAIAGASVVATNIATGAETFRKTTAAGVFVLPLLPAGEYNVVIKANGFQTLTQAHVIVEALATVAVNPTLQIGSATQSVTVTDQPTSLKTDDVALGSSIDNRVYDALPLAMNGAARDPSAFAGLASGVSNYSTQAAGPSTGSFNGGQTYQNEVYIEGLPLTSAGTESDTRNLAFGVSVEAVDQFQVETNGAKAMYEGQGVSNYVFKSGTNQFHGGVSNISAIPISTPEAFSRSPRRSSIRTSSDSASAAPSRRTSSFSSATMMAIVSCRRPLPDSRPSRRLPSGPAILAPFLS